MKMYKYIREIICWAVFGLCMLGPACEIPAAGDGDHEARFDEAMADAEMGGKISGQVIRVDPVFNTLIIKSPIADEGMVTVTARSATTYFGTASLKTIKPGDLISIDTITFRGNYYADNIVMQEAHAEDEKPAKLEKVLSD